MEWLAGKLYSAASIELRLGADRIHSHNRYNIQFASYIITEMFFIEESCVSCVKDISVTLY